MYRERLLTAVLTDEARPKALALTVSASCMLPHRDACKITFGRIPSNPSRVNASIWESHDPRSTNSATT